MSFKNTYFFYGDESFLIDESIDQLKRKHPKHSLELIPDLHDIDTLFNSIATVSMFSNQKLVLLKNPTFLFSTPTDTQFKQLQDTLSSCDSQNHIMIIYVVNKKIDFRKKLACFLKKSVNSKEFPVFKDWEQQKLVQWIRQRVTTYKVTIDPQAAIALEQTIGNNLRALSNEIEKLISYRPGTPISLETIEAMSAGKHATIFHFSNAMRKRDQQSIMETLYYLLDNGEEPIKLIGLIASNLRLYIQLLSLAKENKPNAVIAKSIGKNPYFIQQLLPDIKKHYSIKKIQSLYSKLADCDLAIKSGQTKPDTAIALFCSHFS